MIGILVGTVYRSEILGLNAFRLSPTIQFYGKRFLLPAVGSLQPPRRTNRALPDPIVDPRDHTNESDAPITTSPAPPQSAAHRPIMPLSGLSIPIPGISTGPIVASSTSPTSPPSTASPHSPHQPVQPPSALNQWVDEITGRGRAAGVRVPTADEIARVSVMFPDLPQDDVVRTLQRR